MTIIKAFAPAKINLSLHVTGQRADGYHTLDSLVVFVNVGDVITVTAADQLSLNITGPFRAGVPDGDENLVLQAAHLIGQGRAAAITLEKNLPPASGIGGGSADAAATLRALSKLWGVDLPPLADLMVLGADVPVCAASRYSRMQGVGDQITALENAPDLNLVLVNPRVEVSTPDVFKALKNKTNPSMHVMDASPAAWLPWLAQQRNDLEAPAIAQQPVIATVLDTLRALPGCQLARMSGSGATCYAIMQTDADIHALRAAHPDWWIERAGLFQPDHHIIGDP